MLQREDVYNIYEWLWVSSRRSGESREGDVWVIGLSGRGIGGERDGMGGWPIEASCVAQTDTVVGL